MSGLVGCTTMREMRPVFSSPARVQVLPASVERNIPHPTEMLLRMNGSPVPAYTTFGSLGATASAPTDDTGWLSKIAVQCTPPSVDLNNPPEAAPAYQVIGSPCTPATDATRLPSGPMYRKRKREYAVVSIEVRVCATETDADSAAAAAATRSERIETGVEEGGRTYAGGASSAITVRSCAQERSWLIFSVMVRASGRVFSI